MSRGTLSSCVAAAMIWLAGCDSDGPTSASPPPAAPLQAGAYVLTLDTDVSADGSRACSQTGLAVTRVAVPVSLSSAGTGYQVTSDTATDGRLRATLTVSAIGLGGTMSGEAVDPDSGVTVNVSDTAVSAGSATTPAALIGTIHSSRAASGSMTATIRLSRGALTRQCLVGLWSLDAR